jgi:formate hydrogenlyase subunit 3/multisubunit Na+/H+ antiporter MnhD subunit
MTVLTFTMLIAGFAFLLALPASQGWFFYPAGVSVVAVLAMAVMAQQYIYSILFLWLAANLAVFSLSGGRPGETTGALRFLVLTSLATMPLLILPRYLESGAGPEAMQTATILMTIGFGVLLMMVPFHGQLVAIAAHAAPMVPAFILSIFPPVVFHIFFALGQAYPMLLKDQLIYDVCRWMGVAAAAIGGLAAMGQRRWGYLVGYATLVDWGAGLIALGQGTMRGMEQATQMLIWRAFTLLLVGTGLTIVFKATGKRDDMRYCRGLFRQRPISLLTLVFGLFSLAAFPLSPGAAGRWPLILDLSSSQPRTAWVLILAGGGIGIGTLAGVRACLGDAEGEDQNRHLEAIVGLGFSLLALWLIGTLFLHPMPWLNMLQRALDAFTFIDN